MTNKPNDTCIGVRRPAPVSSALTVPLSTCQPKRSDLTAPTLNLAPNLAVSIGRN